jgi:hypothetical protein
MAYYVVKYSGPFGFIKPWTAVRDGETFSQQFLTPSMIEGIEKKLFPELLTQAGLRGYIIGHRINYLGISRQQEQTWSKAWLEKKGDPIIEERIVKRKGKEERKEIKIPTVIRRPATGIINRGVLLEPNLYLAFSAAKHAERAFIQHVCLTRNEDLLLPEELTEASQEEWSSERYPGFELIQNAEEVRKFKVGYNRFESSAPMFGTLKSFGDPIRKPTDHP